MSISSLETFSRIAVSSAPSNITCSPRFPGTNCATVYTFPPSYSGWFGDIMRYGCTEELSIPPAMTRSAIPLSILAAAALIASSADPHCRSKVTAGIRSGTPAESAAPPPPAFPPGYDGTFHLSPRCNCANRPEYIRDSYFSPVFLLFLIKIKGMRQRTPHASWLHFCTKRLILSTTTSHLYFLSNFQISPSASAPFQVLPLPHT